MWICLTEGHGWTWCRSINVTMKFFSIRNFIWRKFECICFTTFISRTSIIITSISMLMNYTITVSFNNVMCKHIFCWLFNFTILWFCPTMIKIIQIFTENTIDNHHSFWITSFISINEISSWTILTCESTISYINIRIPCLFQR